MMRGAGFVFGLFSLCAPASCDTFAELYVCQHDSQCVDPHRGLSGNCVDGACAWPAPDCPSMLRFDQSAGPERAGQCTIAPQGDGAAMPAPDSRSLECSGPANG